MHDLAMRNQDDALTPAEKEEMFGFAKAPTLLSILKSQARRALGIKLEKRAGLVKPLMDAALTRLVWQRANGCCEYCQMPQAADDATFEIDHIIARKHVGPTVASNLCLSCFYCNSFKGSDITGLDPKTRKLTPLFNPRRHKWASISAGKGLPRPHADRPRHRRPAAHQRRLPRRTSGRTDRCRRVPTCLTPKLLQQTVYRP